MGLVKLHFAERHESSECVLEDLGGECGFTWEMSTHQRVRTPSSRHVVCHRQRRCEILLDEEVEDLIRVGSWSVEDVLSKRFGRDQALEVLWVCIANDVEHLRPDTGYLILCRDLEER